MHVKQEILDTVQLPLEHPELFADGVKKRSGAGIRSTSMYALTHAAQAFFFTALLAQAKPY
jgi:hypothetical protein